MVMEDRLETQLPNAPMYEDALMDQLGNEGNPEELEAALVIELPAREAISVVNASTALPLAATATAGLLPGL